MQLLRNSRRIVFFLWVYYLFRLDDTFSIATLSLLVVYFLFFFFLLSVCLYIINNTRTRKKDRRLERERECEKEEEDKKRFLIAIRSFHQTQSQSTNQIKGNYRKRTIWQEKKKEDASLRNPAIDFCSVFDTYC